MSEDDVYAHSDPRVATAMRCAAGIIRQHGDKLDATKESAAAFIHRHMKQTSSVGRTRREQMKTIETALAELRTRGLIKPPARGEAQPKRVTHQSPTKSRHAGRRPSANQRR